MKSYIFAIFVVFTGNLLSQTIEEVDNTETATSDVILFSQLNELDEIVIEYSSIGCFHVQNERIKIYNKDEAWRVDYFDQEVKVKSINLSKSDFQRIINFEEQLRQIDSSFGGCTTVDNYIFILNEKEVLKASDDSCNWSGFYKLKKEVLKLKSKY